MYGDHGERNGRGHNVRKRLRHVVGVWWYGVDGDLLAIPVHARIDSRPIVRRWLRPGLIYIRQRAKHVIATGSSKVVVEVYIVQREILIEAETRRDQCFNVLLRAIRGEGTKSFVVDIVRRGTGIDCDEPCASVFHITIGDSTTFMTVHLPVAEWIAVVFDGSTASKARVFVYRNHFRE